MIKKYKNLIVFISIFLISLLGYIWLINTEQFELFIAWAQQNFALYFTLLVLLKIAGIIWPPIPGGLLTLGSIPVVGWFNAYLADTIGSTIGAILAYGLGRKYGKSFLKKLFDEKVLAKVDNLHVPEHKQLEAVIVLRTFYGSISEVISYGSGMINVNFPKFLLGVIISNLLTIIIFFFAENVFSGQNIFINLTVAIFAILLFFKLKGRYFE